jgi:hypothetical protein
MRRVEDYLLIGKRMRRPVRLLLALVVLISFAAVQAAALPDDHQHPDGNSKSHSHCCPACHAGQLPVILETAFEFATPAEAMWWNVTEEIPAHHGVLDTSRSSRAPPA